MSLGRRPSRRLATGALLLALLVAASIASAARAAAAPEAVARPPVPASLTGLESSAEDLVDVALAHDRTRVVATAATLSSSAGSATARALLAAGVTPSALSALRVRVAVVARLSHTGPYTSIALAANAVSAVVVTLYARFADPVPVAVRRLDYLDREAQLRSLAGQRKAVAPVVAQLTATWRPLQGAVVGHGGQRSPPPTGVTSRRCAGSRSRREARSAARRSTASNIVDELETVFSR